MPVPRVSSLRIHAVNDEKVRPDGRFVLYWMIAQRRTHYNFGLQHAMHQAALLKKPLIVLEALRIGYQWASPRLHRFVMDGMADNARRFAGTTIAYHPYLEPSAGHGSGLLEALAGESALVVTDEFPCFFLPRMVKAAGAKLADLGVRLEEVDGNGALPLRVADKTFYAANHFRRFLQRELPRFLEDGAFPVGDPLMLADELPRAAVPAAVLTRWPAADPALLDGDAADFLASLPLDHEVETVDYRGGQVAATEVMKRFMEVKLKRYGEARNEPEEDVPSGLSPYLHFGHIGVHEVLRHLFDRDGFSVEKIAPKPHGSREGFWNISPEGEAFFDELITWREIGYNFAFLREDYDQWESLPLWARQTLETHANDERQYVYSRDELERGKTHDPLWNAAQMQLRKEGRIHNYLRMLWAKKIIEWTPDPKTALHLLIELNNRWSTDGRNPNSYSGIFWTLGRFDRPWAPERKVFGTIRYMSSDNTAKKVRVKGYIQRYLGRGLL